MLVRNLKIVYLPDYACLYSLKDGEKTAHGENFSDAVRDCWAQNSAQLFAIGCNCLDPRFVSPLMRSVNKDVSTGIPLIVYPNSGEQYSPESG